MARPTGLPRETASEVFRGTAPTDDAGDAPRDDAGPDQDAEGRGEAAPESRSSAARVRRPRRTPPAGKAKPRSLYLPDDVHDQLWLQARKKKTTVSAVAADILRRNLPRLRIEADND